MNEWNQNDLLAFGRFIGVPIHYKHLPGEHDQQDHDPTQGGGHHIEIEKIQLRSPLYSDKKVSLTPHERSLVRAVRLYQMLPEEAQRNFYFRFTARRLSNEQEWKIMRHLRANKLEDAYQLLQSAELRKNNPIPKIGGESEAREILEEYLKKATYL